MEVPGHTLEAWAPPPAPCNHHLSSAEIWEETDPFYRWANRLRNG